MITVVGARRLALALAGLAGAAGSSPGLVLGNIGDRDLRDVRSAAAAGGRAAVVLVLGGLTASAVGVGAVVARGLGGALDVLRLGCESVDGGEGQRRGAATNHGGRLVEVGD